MCIISGRRLQPRHGVAGDGLPSRRIPRVCCRSVSLSGEHRGHGSAGSTAASSHRSPAVLQRSARGVGQGVRWGAVAAAVRRRRWSANWTAATSAAATSVEPAPPVRTAVSSCHAGRYADAQSSTAFGRVRPPGRRRWIELLGGIGTRSRRSADTAR